MKALAVTFGNKGTTGFELLNGNDYQLYPDSDADRLRQALAEKLKVKPHNILIGNGSDELLHIVTTAFAGWGTRLCPLPDSAWYYGMPG